MSSKNGNSFKFSFKIDKTGPQEGILIRNQTSHQTSRVHFAASPKTSEGRPRKKNQQAAANKTQTRKVEATPQEVVPLLDSKQGPQTFEKDNEELEKESGDNWKRDELAFDRQWESLAELAL